MNDEYIPVSCECHSEYELAIMHNKTLRVHWRDSEKTRHTTVRPTDLHTLNRAEYLAGYDDTGKHIQIRLDKIIEAHEI